MDPSTVGAARAVGGAKCASCPSEAWRATTTALAIRPCPRADTASSGAVDTTLVRDLDSDSGRATCRRNQRAMRDAAATSPAAVSGGSPTASSGSSSRTAGAAVPPCAVAVVGKLSVWASALRGGVLLNPITTLRELRTAFRALPKPRRSIWREPDARTSMPAPAASGVASARALGLCDLRRNFDARCERGCTAAAAMARALPCDAAVEVVTP
ncbi:MAG: hypothetical protein EOO41_01085, partial [Methanobacteriota archaeon]